MAKAVERLVKKVAESKRIPAELTRIKFRSSPEQIRDFFLASASTAQITSVLHEGTIARADTEIRSALGLPKSTLSRELLWELLVLRQFAEQLSQFVSAERAITRAVIGGKSNAAYERLRLIESSLGKSQWTIRTQLLIAGLAGDASSHKACLARVRENERIDPIVNFSTFYHGLQTDGETTLVQYQSHFDAVLEAQRESRGDVNEFLRFTLTPYFRHPFHFQPETISYGTCAPIVDRFIALRRFLKLGYLHGERLLSPLQVRILQGIAKHTACPTFTRIAQLLGGASWGPPSEVDKRFQIALTQYTRGRYSECADIALRLARECPESLPPYVLAARSAINTGASITDGLAESQKQVLAALLVAESNQDGLFGSLETLGKVALQFSDGVFGDELSAYVARSNYGRVMKGTQFGFAGASAFGCIAANPALFQSLHSDVAKRWKVEFSAGFDSPGVLDLFDLADGVPDAGEKLSTGGIPDARVKRFQARGLIRKGRIHDAIELLHPIATNPNIIAAEDAKSLLMTCLLQVGDAVALTRLLVNESVAKPSNAFGLPLSEAVALGLSARGGIDGEIVWPVLCDMEFRQNKRPDTSPREMALEDYLDAVGVRIVSELLGRNDILSSHPRTILRYFFEQVAMPDNLAGSCKYESSREVEDERMRILRFLVSWEPSRAREYQDEIRRITEGRITENAFQELERTKIRVDIDGVHRELGSSLDSDWAWYLRVRHSQSSTIAAAMLDVLSEQEARLGGDKVKVVVFRDSTLPILVRLLERVRDVFAFSDEYGLDGYLSVGIRHGTLKGKLRAPVARHQVVLQLLKDHSGYRKSEHWTERCRVHGIHESQSTDLHKLLHAFSSDFDRVIDDLNDSKIQIRVARDGAGMFHLVVDDEAAINCAKKITPDTSSDDFVTYAIEYLWGQTDASLKLLRSHITDVVGRDLNHFLNHLQSEVGRSLPEGPLSSEVNEAISAARTDLQRALEEAASWFARSEGGYLPSMPAELPFKLAEQQSQNIHPGLKFTATCEVAEETNFPGYLLRPLSDIAFIAFDNIVKHAGLGDNAVAKVSISRVDSGVAVRISNELGKGADRGALKAVLASPTRSKAENGAPQYRGLVRRDKGSGLAKAMKVATVDIKGGQFSTSFTGDEFALLVTIPAVHLDHVETPAVH